MIEEVKKILEDYGNQIRDIIETPNITLVMVIARGTQARDKFAQQICDLDKPLDRPDRERVEDGIQLFGLRFAELQSQKWLELGKPLWMDTTEQHRQAMKEAVDQILALYVEPKPSCPECDGIGYLPNDDTGEPNPPVGGIRCPNCDGTGLVES